MRLHPGPAEAHLGGSPLHHPRPRLFICRRRLQLAAHCGYEPTRSHVGKRGQGPGHAPGAVVRPSGHRSRSRAGATRVRLELRAAYPLFKHSFLHFLIFADAGRTVTADKTSTELVDLLIKLRLLGFGNIFPRPQRSGHIRADRPLHRRVRFG